jgi:hypothetical protein
MPMRPLTVSQTGVGNKVIPVNRFDDTTTLQVDTSGTVTWAVEWTADNPQLPGPSWSDLIGGAFGGSGPSATFFGYPVRALRLSVSAGDGTATLKILQAC